MQVQEPPVQPVLVRDSQRHSIPPELEEQLDPVISKELKQFYSLLAPVNLEVTRAYALFSAARYLSRAKLPGDIIECGAGSPNALAAIATTLARLNDTDRRLILFDVTGDHRHRAAHELDLWGNDHDLLTSKPRPFYRAPQDYNLPIELSESGYPKEKIIIARYPVDALDLDRPIAFLGLTADTYESNQAAIRTLAHRVSMGGIIAVEGKAELRETIPGCVQHGKDAVAEFFTRRGIDMFFWQIVDRYRMGVKTTAFI